MRRTNEENLRGDTRHRINERRTKTGMPSRAHLGPPSPLDPPRTLTRTISVLCRLEDPPLGKARVRTPCRHMKSLDTNRSATSFNVLRPCEGSMTRCCCLFARCELPVTCGQDFWHDFHMIERKWLDLRDQTRCASLFFFFFRAVSRHANSFFS